MFCRRHRVDKLRRMLVFLYFHRYENEPSTIDQVGLPQGSYRIFQQECPWSIYLSNDLLMQIGTIEMYRHGPMQSNRIRRYEFHRLTLY